MTTNTHHYPTHNTAIRPQIKIGFIGASRVGTNLARLFQINSDVVISGFYSDSENAAQESCKITNTTQITSILQLVTQSDVVFITTRDDKISTIWSLIYPLPQNIWHNKTFVHCSGMLTSEIFSNNTLNGASLHPIFPFNTKNTPVATMSKIIFTLEGGANASKTLQDLLNKINIKFSLITRGDKILYHFICFTLSSGIMALSASMFKQSQNTSIDVFDILPLSLATIQNLIDTKSIKQSLTGPIPRGDVGILKNYFNLVDLPNTQLLKYVIENLAPYTDTLDTEDVYSLLNMTTGEKPHE